MPDSSRLPKGVMVLIDPARLRGSIAEQAKPYFIKEAGMRVYGSTPDEAMKAIGNLPKPAVKKQVSTAVSVSNKFSRKAASKTLKNPSKEPGKTMLGKAGSALSSGLTSAKAAAGRAGSAISSGLTSAKAAAGKAGSAVSSGLASAKTALSKGFSSLFKKKEPAAQKPAAPAAKGKTSIFGIVSAKGATKTKGSKSTPTAAPAAAAPVGTISTRERALQQMSQDAKARAKLSDEKHEKEMANLRAKVAAKKAKDAAYLDAQRKEIGLTPQARSTAMNGFEGGSRKMRKPKRGARTFRKRRI